MGPDPIFTLAITTLGTILAASVYQAYSVHRELKLDAAPARARRHGSNR